MNILLVENYLYPSTQGVTSLKTPNLAHAITSHDASKDLPQKRPLTATHKPQTPPNEEHRSLSETLEAAGHQVTVCQDADTGLETFCSGHFDFCLFDIMLPGIDGFTLTERVRARSAQVPIVLITERTNKQDKIKGFNLGIDDYITRPYDEEELICRLKAIARRCHYSQQTDTPQQLIFQLGATQFDYPNLLLTHGTKKHRLTPRESEILHQLSLRKNQIVRRTDLLIRIWGKSDYFHGRSLDVFITKLRRHLKSDPQITLKNIPRTGYILSDRG